MHAEMPEKLKIALEVCAILLFFIQDFFFKLLFLLVLCLTRFLTFMSYRKCHHFRGAFSDTIHCLGFLCRSVGKESACNAEDSGRFLGWEDPLEKEMATHSSILAWRIPWTEEPGGLHTVHGVAKSRHDLATITTSPACCCSERLSTAETAGCECV